MTIGRFVRAIVVVSFAAAPFRVAAQQTCEFEVTRYIDYETWSGDEIRSGLRADGVFHHVTPAGEYDADVMRYLDASGAQVELRYSGGLFHHVRRAGGAPEASRFLTYARARIEGEGTRRVMRARYLAGRGPGSGVFCVEEVSGGVVTGPQR